MKRVLLLDTAFAARPIHDWLMKQEFEVWTIGNRPADVLARRDPSRYLQGDYADVATVQAHIDRLNIRHVVPGCTDVSIETAQRLTVPETVFDSPETYQQLSNKAAFRGLCATLGLPAPRRIAADRLPLAGQFIAKPSDSFSGRGISVFNGDDPAAGLRALTAARAESRNGEALIETFVDGQLHSYSCFLECQRVTDAVIVREDGSVTPYAVDTSHVVWDFPAAGVAQVKRAIENLARYLALVDGLLHVQFIWDGENVWLIELGRRCPGDLYPSLVELGTGLQHAARYASYFVARRHSNGDLRRRHILRHTLTARHGNYEGVWLDDAAPILEIHPLAGIGREAPSEGRIDRVGLLFMEYSSDAALSAAHEHFLHRAAYHVHS
jgi:hypothetical protein